MDYAPYQVIVAYLDPKQATWFSAMTHDADMARSVYAHESNQMARQGYRLVALTRNGTVVAQSRYVTSV